MAVVRVEMSPSWRADLSAAETALLAEKLGPAILDDAQRGCPVDTGRLKASLDLRVHEGDPPYLTVGSYPDDEGPVEYAAAVEMGFHGIEQVREYVNHNFMGSGREVLIRAHERHANTPEQPYLRPALYRVRSA